MAVKSKKMKRIVLAYSGGLDTSIIIPWLKENYDNPEIIGVCTNVGQNEDWSRIEKKALASGAAKLFIKDIREEFARDYLFHILRAGAVYEGKYLLGTSIARPLQAKYVAETALKEKADAVAHGCTGKGNDQVRFELAFRALAPKLEIIAPWREWDINSREDAIAYAESRKIDLGGISRKNIYSRDWNMWHMSHEGADLEDPWNRPQDGLFQLTKSPKAAADKEREITLSFEKGFPTALDGVKLKPHDMVAELNRLGAENGIGRDDVVEDRTVGMKSRGVYENPAGTILYRALKELEMLTLDFDTQSVKGFLSQRYAELVYTGKWFTPAREALEAFFEKAAEWTTGDVRLVLYKGNVIIAGRRSPYSLYREDLASFGPSSYNHGDATGFVKLYGLPSAVAAAARKKKKP
ncbi:MAG: argininosuccinate synthase [Spirochaetales bacterium]|jgi:argininosuccinate synthase|nr:argininosuccinate synthase [Spirochaetales bacterium]